MSNVEMYFEVFMKPYLIGGLNPSEKYGFVNWGDYSQYMEKNNVPNLQPAIID